MRNNPYPKPRPRYGRLMYGSTVLMEAEWKLLGYYKSQYAQDPTLDKKKLKITY